jgi:hypothetical protein
MTRFVANFTATPNPSAWDIAYTALFVIGATVSVAFVIAWSVYVFGLIALGVLVAGTFFVWALFLRGCSHKRTTFPIRGREHCLDCGRSRSYTFGASKQGRWMK